MIHELVIMTVGIGGPTTLFLYCAYFMIKPVKQRYSVGDEALRSFVDDRTVTNV